MTDELWRIIPLTRGKFALVDADDYADISQFKWHACLGKSGKYYAARKVQIGPTSRDRITELMHRRVMHATKGMEVDHVCGDTLDNRKSNLRLATHQQNQCNRSIQRNNTSGYKGIYANNHNGSYQAFISVNGRQINLGRFANTVSAAKAYDAAALHYYGKFARLNFPEGF